jgi:hypothetical protein
MTYKNKNKREDKLPKKMEDDLIKNRKTTSKKMEDDLNKK